MGGLHGNLFLTVLDAGKSEIKVSADLVLDEGFLLDLQTDIFIVSSHDGESYHLSHVCP